MRYRQKEIKGSETGRIEGQREYWWWKNGSGDYVNCWKECSRRDPRQWGSCESRDLGRDKWGERGGYHFSEAVTYSLGLAPAHRLIKDIQITLVDLYRGFSLGDFTRPTRLQDFEDIMVSRNSSIGAWEGWAITIWQFSVLLVLATQTKK